MLFLGEVFLVVNAFNVVLSNNNILCTEYDKMSAYTGTWTFSKTDNNTCNVTQTAHGNMYLWFGSADGSTPDADYSDDAFIVETSVVIYSGRNVGILYRGVSLSSSQFYYFDVDPDWDEVHSWSCCWHNLFRVSQAFNYGELYKLKLEADGEYYNFSVNGVMYQKNFHISGGFTTGSIGLISHESVSTFYSLNYTKLVPTAAPTSTPTHIPTSLA